MHRSLRQQHVLATSNRPKGLVSVNPRQYNLKIDLGPDTKVRWARRFYNSVEQDLESLNRRLDSGWAIVQPEEVPDLAYLVKDGMIQKDGQVLIKIDAETAASHVAYYEDIALGNAAGARSAFEDGTVDSRMPRFSDKGNKQKVIKGHKPL